MQCLYLWFLDGYHAPADNITFAKSFHRARCALWSVALKNGSMTSRMRLRNCHYKAYQLHISVLLLKQLTVDDGGENDCFQDCFRRKRVG